MAQLTVVVLCGSRLDGVVDTLQSARADGLPGDLAIVADDRTPPAADEWLSALAGSLGGSFARAAAPGPGAARNAGIATGRAPLVACVDAGDTPAAGYLAGAAARMEAEPDLALVTSGVRALYLTHHVDLVPPALDLTAVAAAFDTAHASTVFRRSTWQALGGFDEAYEALEDVDFWMRALGGGRGAVLPDVPLLCPMHPQSRYRRALDAGVHARSVDRLLARHRATFERVAADALGHRERRLYALSPVYHEAVARRDRLVDEMGRIERAFAALLPVGAPPFDLAALAGRRVTPVSADWGYDRGVPVDRFYIEGFLERHAADIRGVVLEIQEPDYTRRFGADRVARSEVLDLDGANPRATIVGDLRRLPQIGDGEFDCIILTQTLHVIDDMPRVVADCARLLRPGGVLLATLPAASRVCLEYGRDGDFWRVTEAGARRLFGAVFSPLHLEVEGRGNVSVTTAFLHGLAQHEVSPEQFAFYDPYNPTLVCVRATKARRRHAGTAGADAERAASAVLLYHRVAAPGGDVHGLAVGPRRFRDELEQMRAAWRPVPMDALAAEVAAGRVGPKGLALTFDDGYADNLLEASETLLALAWPATFFVTTAHLDSADEYWWDTLERGLLGPGSRPARLEIRVGAGEHVHDTSSDGARRTAHDLLYRAILPLPVAERDRVIAAVADWAGSGRAAPANRRLTSGQLRELASRPGHTIGAHTANHLALTLHPPAVALEEMRASRLALEHVIGRAVAGLAYPFGAWNRGVARLARDAGFTYAVTCEPGLVTATASVMALPRFDARDGMAGLAAARP